MISKEMIEKGFKNNIMTIEDEFDGYIGLCCRIGDKAFYYATFEDRCLTTEEYFATYTFDEIVNELYNALKDWETAEEYGLDEEEYRYYETILTEKPVVTKNLWARIGYSLQVTDEEYEELKSLMENNPSEARKRLYTLFNERGEKNGDSYLPVDCDDNPNSYDFEF